MLERCGEPIECASYKGKKYLQFNIENEINELPLYQKNKIKNGDNLKAIIKGLILRDTLYNIAVSKGYDTIKVVNKTYKKLVSDLFMRYKTVEVMKKSSIPDSVVYNYYKDNINSFMSPKEISVLQLVVDNKHLADSLKVQAEQGADFSKLVREYSLKKSNDDREMPGYSDLDEYGYLKDTLWNSPSGDITGPFSIDNNYVLLKVMGKKDGSPLDFDLIKNRVTMFVKKQMRESLLRDYANNLKKSVNIKINYDILWDYKISGLSNKTKLN